LSTPRAGYRAGMQQESAGTVEQEEEARERFAARVGELALARGVTIAVAESLTGGMIADSLAVVEKASEWFRGSLVAYSSEVKHEVLGVPPGPVVSAEAASAMARGVRSLLLADLAVGVTGAGGPSAQDGREPGTVFLAVDAEGYHRVLRLELDGDPAEVAQTSAAAALEMLVAGLEDLSAR
jgi:nicotinamide-nucleotide amidase